MSLVIDVHTHMLSRPWLDMLRKHGGPRYSVKEAGVIADVIHMDGAAFMTPLAGDITGCLGRVNSLAEGVRQAVRGRNAQRIFNIT